MLSAQARFAWNVATSAGLMAGVMLLPKEQTPGDLVRLGMTLLFLLAAVSLAWSFSAPLEAALAERWSRRFDGVGPEIGHTLGLLRTNVMIPVRRCVWLAIATLGWISIDVLSAWPAFDALAPLDGLAGWGWRLSLLGLVAAPILSFGQVSQAINLARLLAEQLATSGIDFERSRGMTQAAGPPVEIVDVSRFRAGGFVWDWSDFHKNVVVFGQPGSGKTVCVLNSLLEGLVRCGSGSLASAGLILDPKGDFRSKIVSLMRRIGRENDLLIFDPDDPDSLRWNPFDTPDSAEEVANRFGAVFSMQGQGGDKDAFFIQHSKQFLQYTLALLRLTGEHEHPPSTLEFTRLMGSDEVLRALIDAAKERTLDPFSARWRDAALAYLEGTWLTLAPETLSGINSTLSTVLTPFNNPPFDELMGGRSSVTLGQAIHEGKVIYVHFPVARRRMMAQIVGTLLKVEYGRQVLQKEGKARPSFMFCDEFQVFLTTDKETADADFFERSRGSNHANIVATQTRPALLQRSKEPHPIDHLLGCCATKIFLRNTSPETNEWASAQFGERLQTIVSTARSASTSFRQGQSGGASLSTTTNTARRIKPDRFASLSTPSVPQGIAYADSIVHFAARTETETLSLRWPVHPL